MTHRQFIEALLWEVALFWMQKQNLVTTLNFRYQNKFSHNQGIQIDDMRFVTLAHENPLTRVCCFIDSDLNFSIFHSVAVSPTNEKLETHYGR